jgi:hypothetical protein
MTDEIFKSAVRSSGDLAGVFEYDGQVAYFYLYASGGSHPSKVLHSIHIWSGRAGLRDEDIFVFWDRSERKVGLFIDKVMWAVFDSASGQRFGGNYESGARPSIPTAVTFNPN